MVVGGEKAELCFRSGSHQINNNKQQQQQIWGFTFILFYFPFSLSTLFLFLSFRKIKEIPSKIVAEKSLVCVAAVRWRNTKQQQQHDLFIGVCLLFTLPDPPSPVIYIHCDSFFFSFSFFSFERSIKVMGRDCESTCLNNSNGWIRAPNERSVSLARGQEQTRISLRVKFIDTPERTIERKSLLFTLDRNN